MLMEEIKENLLEIIKDELDPAFIILFGSFARGTEHANSDIDLAYFSDKQLSSYELFLLTQELVTSSGYEVDLVDIKQINTVFTMQIFEHGIPIYIKDRNEFTRQKMRAYSMYATLNEQRAPIIKKIKERGSIYGNK